MDMKVYVSCYIPSIKQTVMRIIYIHSESTILEARDKILQALGLGEKRILLSLGLEREEYLFSGTQVYIEALHTHIDVLHLPPQHRLEPYYTLQEEFMRHEHRSPKVGDIFKLRLMLPKFNEELPDENGLAALEVLQGRKRNLEEANCEAVIKKAKLLPTSMVASIKSLREHLKTSDPLSCPEWMELNLPVADVAVWVVADNRFATNDGRFAFMGRLQYKKLRHMISQILSERSKQTVVEGVRAYDSVKSPNSYIETIGNILIVGPVGIGKSHLLAAAVSDFTEEFQRPHVTTNRRKRVVSIVDCELLRHDQAFKVIHEALFVAFGDDDKNLLKLENCSTSNHLIDFCENVEDTLLWLLDQWEAINGDHDVKNTVLRLTCNHSMICATNTNFDLTEKANYGLAPTKCYTMDEGLNDEELECWGRWKFVSSITDGEKTKELLDEMELQILLDATGRLPLYLSAWYDALKETIQQTTRGEKMSFEFAMRALQSQVVVDKMREHLSQMFENAQNKSEFSKFINGIGKYMFGSPMLKPLKDIDNRYFHFVNGHGAPSCGLVGSELARLIAKHKQHKIFFDAPCLNVIRREFGPSIIEKHPMIGGALLERAIIGIMGEQPLAFPLGNMTRLCPTLIELEVGAEHATVEDLYMDYFKGGKEEALSMVIPLSTTYKAIDAVLVGFRRESKGCHMYISGLQISSGKLPKHRLSRKVFMNRMCTKWVPSSLNLEDDVSWSMNWILPEIEIPNYHGLYIKEKDSFELRSHSNIGKGKMNKEVDCLEVFTMFRKIDSRLGFLDKFQFK